MDAEVLRDGNYSIEINSQQYGAMILALETGLPDKELAGELRDSVNAAIIEREERHALAADIAHRALENVQKEQDKRREYYRRLDESRLKGDYTADVLITTVDIVDGIGEFIYRINEKFESRRRAKQLPEAQKREQG